MSRSRTIERTFRRTSMLVAFAITVVLLYLVYLTVRLEQTVEAERRSARVVTFTLALQLRTIDLETSQRGFVLTGDEAFLAPYDEALERIEQNEAQLPAFVANDPGQRRRVAQVLHDLHEYIDDFADPNVALARRDRRAAGRRIADRDGMLRTDALRAQFMEIVDIERARRDERTRASEALARRAKIATGVAIAGILFVLGGFIAFIGTAVLRPMREVRDVVVRIAGGDLRARPPRTYQGEAEDLSDAIVTMAAELEAARATLEQRARLIEEHARALERSNADLEQFAYAAAHDLQEPLRMVASYTSLLQQRYHGRLDDDADDFIRYSVDGAKRMQRLINDLLTYSRVTSAADERRLEVSVADALADALANLTVRIAERNADVQLDVDPGVRVRGNSGQMTMLLQNLVGNAVRHAADPEPVVRVSVQLEGQRVIGTVDDNGPGIEPEYRDRVFRIFQRLGHRDEHAGTGIGLALCRRIVERHGGSIHVEDAPLGGARFCFDLPGARHVRPQLPGTAEVRT